MNKKFNRTALILNRHCRNIINVFSITLKQFNAPKVVWYSNENNLSQYFFLDSSPLTVFEKFICLLKTTERLQPDQFTLNQPSVV